MATTELFLDPPMRSLYRLSVAQYDDLAQSGVLTKADRIELIEGLLVEKLTKNERHLTTISLIQSALARLLPEGWFAVTEWPIRLAGSEPEPEPDAMIVRGRIQDYFQGKPRPADVPLLIEVSDSSDADDRARRHYFAESGIPIYWIANIPTRRIEVYTQPMGHDYQNRHDRSWDDHVEITLEKNTIRLAVSNLMPPPE